jgi:hypothetical protein
MSHVAANMELFIVYMQMTRLTLRQLMAAFMSPLHPRKQEQRHI